MNRIYTNLKLRHLPSDPILDDPDHPKVDTILMKWAVVRSYEDKLHVSFSRRIIAQWVSLFLMVAGIILMIYSAFVTAMIFGVASACFFLARQYFINNYRNLNMYYKFSLSVIEISQKNAAAANKKGECSGDKKSA